MGDESIWLGRPLGQNGWPASGVGRSLGARREDYLSAPTDHETSAVLGEEEKAMVGDGIRLSMLSKDECGSL